MHGGIASIGVSIMLLVAVAAVPRVATAQTVDVWVTANNKKTRLRQQAAVAFSSAASSGNVIYVDEGKVYQEIEGFGASLTDSSAYLLNRVATPSARATALDDLFTRDGAGIGIGFLRNPMGASDLARSHYSYDDLPPGQTDPDLVNFSIAHDEADIIPLVLAAKQLNPRLKIIASPWSAPGWMKSSGSLIGGALLPSMYTPFARYFVRYVKAYEAVGIPIDYISLQNEPLYVPSDYPGTSMDAATQTVLLRDHILPAFAASGITTRVLVYDHNWDRPDYPERVLADPILAGSDRIAGTAWHGYGGGAGAMAPFDARYPGKGNYVTEISGGAWVDNQLKSDFETITLSMRSSARSFVKWGLALDERSGPHTGGCATCSPLVTVDSVSGRVTYTTDYYSLGHFSKFVLTGARRVSSTNASGVISAAFVNPDGSKALVVYNDTKKKRAFQVQWGTKSFTYTLGKLSGATFTWRGTQSGGHTVSAKSRIQASSFDAVSGLQAEVAVDPLGGFDLGYADDGDYAVYEDVDFASGVGAVSVSVASAGTGGSLELRLDGATGPLIGSVTIPVTGGWQTWRTVTGTVSGASGRHDLYVVFKGTTSIGNLNWFEFN